MKNLFSTGIQVLRHFGKTHASTILSVASSIGTIAAVVLCGEATVKAVRLVDEKKPEGTVEMIKTVAPEYAPTVAATALSIACGFKSNDISKKRTAALTTLLNLSENMTNGKERAIPIPQGLLAQLSPRERTGFVLNSYCDLKRERPLSYTEYRRSFDRIRKLCGIEEYSAHDFRDTCATEWRESGISIDMIARLLGH